MFRRSNVTILIVFFVALVVMPRYAFGGALPIVVTSETLKQLYKDHINNVVMVKSELKDFQKQSQEKKNDDDCDDDDKSFLKTGIGSVVLLPHFYTTEVNKRAQGVRPYGIGTGFVKAVRGMDVYIATNQHVVEDAISVTVMFQNKEYVAEVINSDPKADAALLKIVKKEISDPFEPVVFGNSRTVEIGEPTMSIGNFLGLLFSLSSGSVAQFRPFTDSPMFGFQLDQATYPGDSGSPLYNYRGEVIGVVFALIRGTDRGLAIPINEFNAKIDMWMKK